MGTVRIKVQCDVGPTVDGAAITKCGRMVAAFPVSQYGGMTDAQAAAEEYRGEFGGVIVGYRLRWVQDWAAKDMKGATL
jgi:hypothetical protein